MSTAVLLNDFLKKEFPQSKAVIDSVNEECVVLRMPVIDANLRPGGTVSGPTMMALADVAVYVAILAKIGIVPLAVTTNFSINFLQKPIAGCDLIAKCKLLKSGRTLMIGEVSLYSDGMNDVIAHAVATYAIPPKRESDK